MLFEWYRTIFLYSIISKPLAQKYHWSVLYGGVAFVWLSSMGVVLPETLKYRVTDYGCFPYEDAAEVTSSFIKATVYVVYSPFSPILLIIIVYYLTARALKMNTMRHENNRAMELRNKRNAKIVRMFIIIIMLYFLLTIPHAISYIYGCYVFFVDTWNSNYEIINTMTYILSIPASANCCVNPIIYARMHRDISKYLGSVIQRIKMACFQFCKRRNESTPAPSATWSLSTLKSNWTTIWKSRILILTYWMIPKTSRLYTMVAQKCIWWHRNSSRMERTVYKLGY